MAVQTRYCVGYQIEAEGMEGADPDTRRFLWRGGGDALGKLAGGAV